jgi:hypothetical protein
MSLGGKRNREDAMDVTVEITGCKPFVMQIHDAVGSDNEILEDVYDACNDGSGMACQEWRDAEVYSMTSGDVVEFEGRRYRCEPIGWKLLS